jgi:hypothetical protein
VDKPFGFVGWAGTLRLARIIVAPEIDAGPRPPFTLIFEGPRGEVLPEGLYTAVIDGTAAMEFYIMPIHTPAANRQDYQAVFN